MRHLIAVVLGTLALAVAPAALADGAVRVDLNAANAYESPCNGEIIIFRGAVTVLYHEAGDKYVLHFWFHDTGVGSFGNEYLLLREAEGVFDAPTFVRGDGTLVFEIDGHGEVISKGTAPNFSLRTSTRIFVRDGVPVGTQSIAVEADCHG